MLNFLMKWIRRSILWQNFALQSIVVLSHSEQVRGIQRQIYLWITAEYSSLQTSTEPEGAYSKNAKMTEILW